MRRKLLQFMIDVIVIIALWLVILYIGQINGVLDYLHTRFIRTMPIKLYVLLATLLAVFFIKALRNNSIKVLIVLTVIYFIFIVITLFARERYSERQFSTLTYIKTWWSYLMTNRIVFVNIFGNIILFMPFGLIIKKYCNYIKSQYQLMFITVLPLLIIVLIEITQYYTKLGVFDFLDIILNFIGVWLGYLWYYLFKKEVKHGI